MGKVVYERKGSETSLYTTAVTYPNGAVARCTVYPKAPESVVYNDEPEKLKGYERERIDIPLSRVVRVER